MLELTDQPKWAMNCNKCQFLGHDPATSTDWYLNLTDQPACLLVKYGDHDTDYDFHVFHLVHPTPPADTEPEALHRAWKHIVEHNILIGAEP